jgi:hypothetical protein
MLVLCFDSQFLFFFSCRLVAIWWRVWRARFVLSSNETQAGLKISSLHLADEGLYRCEITYLEINEGCPVVQYVNLTVLGMYQTFRFIVFFFSCTHIGPHLFLFLHIFVCPMEIYISWYIIWESTFDVFLLSTSPSIDYVLYIAADSFRSHFLPVPYSIFPLLSDPACLSSYVAKQPH